MTSGSPREELSALIEAVPDLSAPSTNKFPHVAKWFAGLTGISPEEVFCAYASKPGNLTKFLQQPGSLSTKKSLGIAILGTKGHFDQYVKASSKISGSGLYGAVALCARVGEGIWSVVHVTEVEGGPFTARLRESFPDLSTSSPSKRPSGSDAKSASNTWLEITNRPDIGANLLAPKSDEHWSWTLLTRVQAGDVIYHYSTEREAIVGVSRATGRAEVSEIEWPERRAAWKVPLSDYCELVSPVTLQALRSREDEIRAIKHRLEQIDQALYFPFGLSEKQVLRPQQAYLTRFPTELLALFPQLTDHRLPMAPHSSASELSGLPELFTEFLETYWRQETGRDHAHMYSLARQEAERNFEALRA